MGGVRRFQNKDGTLTPAGRLRYGQVSSNVKSKGNRYTRYTVQRLNEVVPKHRTFTFAKTEFARNPFVVAKAREIDADRTRDSKLGRMKGVEPFNYSREIDKARELLGKHSNDVVSFGKHDYKAEEFVAASIKFAEKMIRGDMRY